MKKSEILGWAKSSWPTSQSPESNLMENVSRGLVELETLHLDLADGAGDDWSCLHDERWSGCQPLEGGVRAMVHVHERSLAGRGVGCLAVSRATLLE